MKTFCTDRDLLVLEPSAFLDNPPAGQQLLSGSGGQLLGGTFSAAGADFLAAGIQPRMVLVTYGHVPAEGAAWEIISADSATQLTVSVLRASVEAAPIAPADAEGLNFYVLSFLPQIAAASESIAERLRRAGEATDLDAADFVPSDQLRLLTAVAALETVFTAQVRSSRSDAPAGKAEAYRRRFARDYLQLRLAVDADGDGTAESTRSPANVQLRRV